MNIDIVSDLHDDINWSQYNFACNKESDIILIAGDMTNIPEESLSVISRAAKLYDQVIFTDGNHDHYSCTKQNKMVSQNCTAFLDFSKSENNVTYLDLDKNPKIQIDDVLFVGGNGWYDFQAATRYSTIQQRDFWKTYMNDAKLIQFDTPPDELANKHAAMAARIIADAQADVSVKHIVMMTHTIPMPDLSVGTTHPFYYLNGSFVNTKMSSVLDADICHKIDIWLYGHTHFHNDRVMGETECRFICNAKGYVRERENNFIGQTQIKVEKIKKNCLYP